jgi:hypothetical protein
MRLDYQAQALRRLKESLGEIESLWTERGRLRLLTELRASKLPLDVEVAGTTGEFVSDLVTACLSRADGLTVLTDVVTWLEHDSETARRVLEQARLVRLAGIRAQEDHTARPEPAGTADPAPAVQPSPSGVAGSLMPSHEDIRRSLAALGVPADDIAAVAAWIEASVAWSVQATPAKRPESPNPLVTGDPAVQGFLNDLLNFLRPQRLFTSSVYLSQSKVGRYFRAYRQAMIEAGDWNGADKAPAEEKFLAIYRHLGARGLAASAPILQLLGSPLPADPETMLYFTGEFTLRLEDEILDLLPEKDETKGEKAAAGLHGGVSSIFGAADPFFYPIVRFAGYFWGREVVLALSRKYLEVDSRTYAVMGRALHGRPVAVAGFGMIDEPHELYPLVLRMLPK